MSNLNDISDIWATLSEANNSTFLKRIGELKQLVHYTSFSSLYGIIQNQELWFSPVAAMNDYDEVTRGRGMLEKFASDAGPFSDLMAEIMHFGQEIGIDFNEAYRNSLDGDLFDTFVSCWSSFDASNQTHDNLAMWRGYAAEGNGAALVIDPLALGMSQAFESHIVAYPVFYEKDQEFLDRSLSHFRMFLDSLNRIGIPKMKQYSGYAISAFSDLCFHLAITHKHPGFYAEREWRFVWRRHRETDPKFVGYAQPKVTPRGMFEYFCFPIRTDTDVAPVELQIQSIINEVMVGPTDDAVLKMRAVRALLNSKGFNPDKTLVTQSFIPYRSIS